MKRILFFLLMVVIGQSIQAQNNVGIGTTTPNPKAALDISSTTKGLLIPSMTTAQRTAITTPPNGLMVYDTDRKSFYHYDGSLWRIILNSDYWNRTSAASNYVTNLQDSIGIGVISPTHRLDVNGNIHSSNNLLADNNINATGSVSGASLITTGNITASGTSFLSGDVTTNSDLIVNNTTATMQLKSSSVNKGFFQLSGNNVRFGTNSGNTTGNLIMRMNGNDRVTINPAGDIDLDGKITRTAVTGNAPLLPVCMGQVSASGGIINGTGNFTVVYLGSSVYEISCPQHTSTSIIIATPVYTCCGGTIAMSQYITTGKFRIISDDPFHFIMYNLF
jgi:hypothetical protein